MSGSAGRTREENVAAGRKKRDVGDEHEAWGEEQHAEALSRWLVGHEVQHNEPKVIETPAGIKRVGVSVADYTSFLNDGRTRTFAAEFKATSGKYLYGDAVSDAQARYLNAVAAGGGLALLVAGFKEGARWRRFAVPWAEAPWRVARSALGVTAALVEGWRVPDDEACYLAKFCTYFVPKPLAPGVVRGRVHARE